MSQIAIPNTEAFVVVGSVKWFDPIKGFGFIEPSTGGVDILLHANVLRNFGVNSVSERSQIETTVRQTVHGIQASEIHAITPPLDVALDHDAIAIADLDTSELVPARVKWFSREKGYGFANAFGSDQDIFIGTSVLRNCGLAEVQDGEAVAVRIVQGERGMIASHVLGWNAAPEQATIPQQQPSVHNLFDVVEQSA